MGKFELKKSKIGKYHFSLLASNGQVLLTSESYSTKAAAEAAIKSAVTSSQDQNNIERRTSANGDYYFVLKSADGRRLGKSFMYASKAARENGIWSVISSSQRSVPVDH